MSKTINRRAKPQSGGRRDVPESAASATDKAITLEDMVRLQAIALPEADCGFTVVIPALGCPTQGDTIGKAQASTIEAAEGWLTSQQKRMKHEAIRSTQG